MLVYLRKNIDWFYLDAGKLGLKQFCSFAKCLQPAPLSPGSQPQSNKVFSTQKKRGVKDKNKSSNI